MVDRYVALKLEVPPTWQPCRSCFVCVAALNGKRDFRIRDTRIPGKCHLTYYGKNKKKGSTRRN